MGVMKEEWISIMCDEVKEVMERDRHNLNQITLNSFKVWIGSCILSWIELCMVGFGLEWN